MRLGQDERRMLHGLSMDPDKWLQWPKWSLRLGGGVLFLGCKWHYGVAHPLLAPDEIASPVVESTVLELPHGPPGTQYPVLRTSRSPPPCTVCTHPTVPYRPLCYPTCYPTVPFDNLEIPPVRHHCFVLRLHIKLSEASSRQRPYPTLPIYLQYLTYPQAIHPHPVHRSGPHNRPKSSSTSRKVGLFASATC